MHGYQIMTELASRSVGAWRPSAGSICPTLQAMAAEGLGHDARQDTEDELTQLADLVTQVVAAAMQVAQAGTLGQVSRAGDLLNSTRRRLYRLLAEESEPQSEPEPEVEVEVEVETEAHRSD